MINLKKILKLDETLCLILILAYGFFSHLYIISRYGGLVADGDVSYFTKAIQDFQVHGGIGEFVRYSNGLGFQIIATEISDITGLTIPQVQLLPFGFFYLIIAYLLFREFTDSKYTALIGAVVLSLLPDLLFITARGTHERYTFFLFLLSLFILVRYSKNSHSLQKSATYVAILYCSLLTMALINQWFFVLILIAIISTTFLGLIQSLFFKTNGDPYKRMLFSIIPIILLSYLLVQFGTSSNTMFSGVMSIWLGKFFTFSPHVPVLPLLGVAVLLVLILYVIHTRGNHFILQYGFNAPINNLKKNKLERRILYVIVLLLFLVWIPFVYYFIAPSNTTFHSPGIYFFLTGIYWIILPISVLMGLIIVKHYTIDKNSEYAHKNLGTLLFLSFFGLFGLSVFIDRIIHSGVGDNLELRVFPYLLVFSAGITACAVFEISTNIVKAPWKKLFVGLIIVAFAIFSISSLLKATNDPSVSDFKIYYSPEEKNGINWLEINNPQSSITFREDRFSTAFAFNSYDYAFKNVHGTQENTADVFMGTHDYLRDPENFDFHTILYDNANVMIFREN
ncbi:MAG: hypothetical protein WC626_06415 [Methanoregula sp.]